MRVLAAGKKEGGAIVVIYHFSSDFSGSSSIHLLLRMVTQPSKDCPVYSRLHVAKYKTTVYSQIRCMQQVFWLCWSL